MYFNQKYPSSRYQKQSYTLQKEIIYATWGSKGCRVSYAAIIVFYYVFIFPAGAIPQLKLAICRTKKYVKFSFLPLYIRPFLLYLSPGQQKKTKAVYIGCIMTAWIQLAKAQSSKLLKGNEYLEIWLKLMGVPGALSLWEPSRLCPVPWKGAAGPLCNWRDQILTPLNTVAQSWNHFPSVSLASPRHQEKKKKNTYI